MLANALHRIASIHSPYPLPELPRSRNGRQAETQCGIRIIAAEVARGGIQSSRKRNYQHPGCTDRLRSFYSRSQRGLKLAAQIVVRVAASLVLAVVAQGQLLQAAVGVPGEKPQVCSAALRTPGPPSVFSWVRICGLPAMQNLFTAEDAEDAERTYLFSFQLGLPLCLCGGWVFCQFFSTFYRAARTGLRDQRPRRQLASGYWPKAETRSTDGWFRLPAGETLRLAAPEAQSP